MCARTHLGNRRVLLLPQHTRQLGLALPRSLQGLTDPSPPHLGVWHDFLGLGPFPLLPRFSLQPS